MSPVAKISRLLTFVFTASQCQGEKMENEKDEYTLDGTVDNHGQPAVRARTGSESRSSYTSLLWGWSQFSTISDQSYGARQC
ncbi:hypothetical protein P3S67_005329 [Capsicum chacoense]